MDRTNILIIMSDQHAARFMGNVDPMLQTPNLDALARGGVVFDAAYCPSPICVPSRASFMTTRYPHEIGVLGNAFALDSYAPTFVHAATPRGYETALIGRMHFNGADQRHGFQKHLVGDVSPAFPGKPAALGPFRSLAGPKLASLQNSGAGITGLEYFDNAVASATGDALRDWKRRKSADPATPPFLYVVGLYRPHCPYRAPRELFELYEGRVTLPDRPPVERLSGYARRYFAGRHLEQATDDDLRRALAAYCGLVTGVDAHVGRIMRALDEVGEAQNTLLVYTSDHGDHAGDHHLWWKESFYENSARVPLIVRAPGIAVNRRVAEPVSLMDVAATALDYAGAAPLPGTRAESLTPFLTRPDARHTTGGQARRSAPVVCELTPSPIACPGRMVRKGRWKYMYYHEPGIEPELYDMESDPAELRNRAADPACAAVRDELHGVVFADGWDPALIARKVEQRHREAPVLAAWQQTLNPEEPEYFLDHIPESVNQAQ